MGNNVETEIKLLVAKKDLKTLLSSDLVVKKVKKGSHKTLKLTNAYYDTEELLLQQRGIAYRIRQEGKMFEATVKLSKTEAGALTERREYNAPVKSWRPDLSVFAETELTEALSDLPEKAAIQKLFSVRVERDLRLLQITKDTLVEMSIDEGYISAGGKKETVYEVELELKSGSLGDLLDYTTKLSAVVPVFSESRSKYARGMALLDKLPLRKDTSASDINWTNSYREEAQKQFYRYGTAILEEQNVFMHSKLQSEADTIFLPHFEKIRETLFWLRPMLTGTPGMEANLRRILADLYALRETKALLRYWLDLYATGGERWSEDKLTGMLQKQVRTLGEGIHQRILQGRYSTVVFSLWAAMENANWKVDEYLRGDQLLQVRTKDILEKIKTAAEVKDKMKGKRNSASDYLIVAELDMEVSCLQKASEAEVLTVGGKEGRKKLAKLSKALAFWNDKCALAQAVPSELMGLKSVAAAHQAGYLKGALFAEGSRESLKAGKAFKKWLKTLA